VPGTAPPDSDDPVERLRRSVLEGPGHTDPELRRAVAAYAGELWADGSTEVTLPSGLEPYVSKVAVASYKVLDEDVDELGRAGWSEDQILELTLAAAVGCGLKALEAGLAAAGADA
jgi:hypothetical protein